MDSSIKTVGVSPKVVAASVTAYVAPLVVGYLADRFGANVDVSTATALLLPLVTAAVTFAAGHVARPGDVHVDMDAGLYYPDPYTGPNPPAKLDLPPGGERPDPKRSAASKKAARTRKRNAAKKG